jgi:hypothetical protein
MASGDGSLDTGGDVRRPDDAARIGVMQALNRHVERVLEPSGKKHHLGASQACARPMTLATFGNRRV